MWFVKYATSGKVKNYFTKLAKEAGFLNPHTNLTEFKVVRSVSCPSPMPCVIFSSSFPGLLHSALKSLRTWWKEGRHRIGKAVPCPLVQNLSGYFNFIHSLPNGRKNAYREVEQWLTCIIWFDFHFITDIKLLSNQLFSC